MDKKKRAFILLLIIYFFIIFGTEIFYRKKLYAISVEFEQNIKQSGFWHGFFFFWSYIFIYGMMFIATIIVVLYYPYNVMACYIANELSLIIIMCFLKSIYANSRPYWDIYNERYINGDFTTFPTECDGGFGNPSGHSLMSTSFLSLWYLFINSKYLRQLQRKWRNCLSIFGFFLVIICIASVTFSRIHRQIHSFNQIILGTLIGIGIFFLFCFIIEFDKIKPNEFVNFLNKFKFVLLPLFFIFFGISVTLGFLIHNEKERNYEKVLDHFCKYRKEQIFGINTAYHSGLIFILIGGYIGILFLRYNINKSQYNKEGLFYHWNQGPRLRTLKIALFSFLLPVIPLVSIFIIPYKYFYLKFIFEILLYAWYGFAALGLCFYYGVLLFTKEKNIIVSINIY